MTAIPESWSIHIVSLQCGFRDTSWQSATLFRFWYRDTPSLYMNGLLFIQLRFPFWIGVQFRPFTRVYFQSGIGWKGNGRFALLCRFQTDASAAAGMDGPNFGQASFMDDGSK